MLCRIYYNILILKHFESNHGNTPVLVTIRAGVKYVFVLVLVLKYKYFRVLVLVLVLGF